MKDGSIALELKQRGNNSYSHSEYARAIESYSHALRFVSFGSESTARTLRSVLYLNRAQCLMQIAGASPPVDGSSDSHVCWLYERALYDCSRSLSVNPDYVKARHLRGELYALTKQYALAAADFQKLKSSDLTASAQAAYQSALRFTASAAPSAPVTGTCSVGAPSHSQQPSAPPFAPHSTIANANKKLTLNYTPGARGRYMTARQPVSSGEPLIVESPFAAVLNRSFRVPALPPTDTKSSTAHACRCEWCFEKLCAADQPQPQLKGVVWWEVCPNCPHSVYCSAECRSLSWQSEHRFECAHPQLFAASDSVLEDQTILALRMLYRRSSGDSNPTSQADVKSVAAPNGSEGGGNRKSDSSTVAGWCGGYSDVRSLLSHESETAADVISKANAQIDRVFHTFQSGGEHKSATGKSGGDQIVLSTETGSITRSELLHHILQTRTNSYAVTRILSASVDSKSANKKSAKLKPGAARFEDVSQIRIAMAVYPTASLLSTNSRAIRTALITRLID